VPFFAVISGFQGMGMINAPLQSLSKGRLAAATIFAIIEQKPNIIQNDVTKKSVEKINGTIQFDKVNFNYPSRPNVKVLRDMN